MVGHAVTEDFKERAREAFLAKVACGYSVTAAVAESAMSRAWFYRERSDDPAFAEAWDEALDAGTDALEDEARRRAVDGVEEPIVAMGKVARDEAGNVLTVRRYSDSLLTLLLKARRPDKFKERSAVESRVDARITSTAESDAAFAAFCAATGLAAAAGGGSEPV